MTDNAPTPRPEQNSGSVACSVCGASNRAGDETCSSCGEPIVQETAAVAVEQSGAPVAQVRNPGGSSFRDYFIASTVILAIALLAFVFAGPEPPRPATAATASAAGHEGHDHGGGAELPEGHPGSAVTPEQQRHIAELQARVQQNPNDFALKQELAYLLFDVNEWTEAAPIFEEYLKAHPGDDSTSTALAQCWLAMGEYDRAVGMLNGIYRKSPRFQPASFTLFMVYFSKDNRDSARIWLERVAEADPTTPYGVRATEFLEEMRSIKARQDSAKAL